MNNKLLLEVRHLDLKTPSGRILQRDLNFSLAVGQMLIVQGDNGSGKTTLLKQLLSQHQAKGVTLQTHRERIGYIPQLQDSEFPVPITLKEVLDIDGHFDEEKVLELALLGTHHFSLDWSRASGGEKKRTLLTRVLLRDPELLIFDEPFNHLDQKSSHEILQLMTSLIEKGHHAIIMVTHDFGPFKSLQGENIRRLDLI